MATQLFFRNTSTDWGSGNNDAKLDGSSSGWQNFVLSTTRGGTATSADVACVTGPTNGLEINETVPLAWISEPLDADVTISGSITWNLRSSETSMSCNAAINGRLEVIDGATGVITLIDQTARVTELGTSEAAANFAETPAAGVACKRGDRLRVRVFADDAGIMAAAGNVIFNFNGPTGGASGDSYVTLTETLTFVSEPAGSTIYPTDTAPAELTVSDTGFLAGGTYESIARASGADWSNPSNAGASDNVFSTAVAAGSGTDYLVCRNLGISLPAGAVIRGVTVEIEAKHDAAGQSRLHKVQLQNDSGAPIGTAKSDSFGDSESIVTLGVQEDNWGAALTEAIVESANFGVRFWYEEANSQTHSVDRIRVKVFYAMTNKAREAWTSRGAGVQNDQTSTSAGGWTDPIRITDSSGGAAVDWFTKGLAAFTLGGAVRCNIRGRGNAGDPNASPRVEIAVVNNDGSSPTVWAVGTLEPSWSTAVEAAISALIAGGDLAVTNGQRLRIRLYIDDSVDVAMAAATVVWVYYAGTSGGASGDTFLTFTQTLTEAAPPAERVPRFRPYSQVMNH